MCTCPWARPPGGGGEVSKKILMEGMGLSVLNKYSALEGGLFGGVRQGISHTYSLIIKMIISVPKFLNYFESSE